MTVLARTVEALAGWPPPVELENGRVAVRTAVLFPSNALITVFVEGGRQEFRVTDGRGALKEAECVGVPPNALSVIRKIARAFGLTAHTNGELSSPLVPVERLAAIISLVANAARQAAMELVRGARPSGKRDLRKQLRPLLEAIFRDAIISAERPVAGRSNKQHKFDFVVDLGDERRFLIDAVTPDSASINAAVISHIDIQGLKDDRIKQAIVYDDDYEWKAADLGLLRLGAIPVPLRSVSTLLPRQALR